MLIPATSFIGREHELEVLTGVLDRARLSQGRLIMIAGSPGIGKTRLCQEVATIAEQQGAVVLWGRCYDSGGAPPYWPWREAIRIYIQDIDLDALSSCMGSGAADIAEIIPEIRRRFPDLEPPPKLDPEQARFRLFDSLTAFLHLASYQHPMVLFLEDLHGADRSSLLLLEFITRQLSDSALLIVGTYRDVQITRRHPLTATLGQLVYEAAFKRLQLSGLNLYQVNQLLKRTAGATVAANVVQAVYERTEGNPLFVMQIAQLIAHAGGEWSGDTPQAVKDAIGRQLSHLSEACNQLLTTASALGREFELSVLARLMDSPDDELLQLIDEAMEAHILEAATGGRERYRFRHALIQQTLNDSLSPSRKVRLHARLAQALESLYGDESTEHATELAYHFIAAEAVLGPSRGAHYSNVAGQQALASHAYEEALRHFQYALEARRDEAMDRDTADLYFGLAQAQAATLEKPHLVQTSDYLQRAFDYCIETGNVRRAIDIAVHQFGTIEGDNQRLARALELVSPDSHEAGRLLSRSLTILGYSREPLGDDISVYDRAIAIAQRYGDRVLEMQTLVNAGCADGSNLRLHAGIEKHLRAVELASVVDQPFAETHAQFELAFGFVSLGKLAEATYHAQAALASARRARNSWWLTMAFAIHQTLSCLQGDWEAARRYSHQGLEKSMNFATLLSGRAMLECETGNVEQSEWYLDLLLREGIPEAQSHRGMDPNIAVPMVARITGHDERIELAEAINTGILTWPAVTPWYRELAQVGLALTALQHHDHTMIQVCYDALRLVQGRMPHGCPYISGDRLSGLLANACGMTEMATTHFEDALLFCRQAGYWPELAWTCYDYARILNERLASADHDPATRTVRKKAMVLVEEALTMATALGMRPLYTHATTLKKQLLSTVAGRGRPPVALSPDGLTQREVQVLGLVAEGKTNPEIAARLRISPKTVTHHMTSILRKIGASNRTEAAAYAARNGLVTWS